MIRALRLAALVGVTGLLAACPSNPGAGLKVVIARGLEEGGDTCGGSQQQLDTVIRRDDVNAIRLTVEAVSDDAERAAAFDCDVVFETGGDPPPVQLKSPLNGMRVNIHGEAFSKAMDGTVRRVASGLLWSVDLTTARLPNLRLVRTEAYGCAAELMTQPRVFHSATRLPNGEVLIVGGLTSDSDSKGLEYAPLTVAAMRASGTAEVYDPGTNQFVALEESAGTPAAPRAFHQAVLLPTIDRHRYRVLLLGGITEDPAGQPNRPLLGQQTGLFYYSRVGGVLVGTPSQPALTLIAAPPELLEYDADARTLTRSAAPGWPQAGFAAATGDGKGRVFMASGVDFELMNDKAPYSYVLSGQRDPVAAADESTPQVVGGAGLRWAPSLTLVDGGRAALLWGGGLPIVERTPPTPPMPMPPGALIRLSGGTVSITPIQMASTAKQLQFQGAVGFPTDSSGVTRVLLTGGFFGETMTKPEPPDAANAASWLAVNAAAATVTSSAVAMPSGQLPAGWQGSVAVSRSRALVSGGAISSTACPSPTNALWCAVTQSALFEAASGTMTATEAMLIPRLGHTATVLGDGNVLVVGGARQRGEGMEAGVVLVGSAELFNPKSLLPPSPIDGHDPDDILEGPWPPETVREPGKRIAALDNRKLAHLECGRP